MEVNLSTDIRIEVTKWLNSKNKDLTVGFELMKKTGYKPHVLQILYSNKSRRDVPAKLENQLRLFLRYYANPQNPIHKDELTDADFYLKHNEDLPVNNQVIFSDKENLDLYPESIKNCLLEFRDLYVKRSKLHTDLKKAGEGNTASETKARELYMVKIEAISRRMDELWGCVDQFKKNGFLPSDTIVNNKLDVTKIKVNKPEKVKEEKFIVGDDVEILKKQSDNWRTKILKAKNRLKYQTDNKQPKENPMPEGPKRIALERRIQKLEKEKLTIDTALAKLK
jgi:hypothetical protein